MAFGAERHVLHTADDGSVEHAELRFGNGIVMVGSSRPKLPATRGVGEPGQGIYIAVELRDLGYSRQYSARKPEGNAWQFGTYQPLAPKT